MGRVSKVLDQVIMQEIIPVGNEIQNYNIVKETEGTYELTLPPIKFDDFMVGREKEINDIKYFLKRHKKIVIINGIGGIGKTTLCKYIYWNSKTILKDMYDHIAWINYENSIENSFINAFNNLNLHYKMSDTNQDKFERIIYELNKFNEKLLIFIDNVDRVRKQDRSLINLLQLNCHIIITSRMKIFNEDFLYPLDFLDDEECKQLFLKHYKYEYAKRNDEIKTHLSKILRLCGNHSLTIELLSKTANNEELSLSKVYHLLNKEKFDLSKFKTNITTDWDNREYEKSINSHIVKVFSISSLTEKQRNCLINLAFLAPIEINIDKAIQLLNIDVKQIELLSQKGWISYDKKEIKMHRIIKHVINGQRKKRLSSYKYILDNISCMTKWKENYKELNSLIPHAEEIFNEFKSSSSLKLSILAKDISDYYKYQGDMKLSIKYMKKRTTILKKNSNNIYELADSKRCTATLFLEIGQTKKALELLMDVLHIRKKAYKPLSLEIADCYANIGYFYQEMGEYEKVLTNYKKALDIRIRIDGKDGKITAWSYNNLAMTYALIYEYDKGLKYINKAIDIRKNEITKESNKKDLAILDVAQSTNIKGFILYLMRDYEKALPLLENSLKERRKYLGEENAITATAMQRLAIVLCCLGRLNEAYYYIEKALRIFLNVSGENTSDIANTFNTYAILERYKNNVDKAIELHLRAIHIYSRNYSSNHPRLLQLYEDLALTYEYFDIYIDAVKYYTKALEIGKRFLKSNSWKLNHLNKKINKY